MLQSSTGKPPDLLPDRTAEAVLPWLKSHQEIEVVSRDRASAYADAIKRALPHALQVADRYRLVQNLREHLQRFLDRKCPCLPVVEDILLKEGLTTDTARGGSLDARALGEVRPATASSSQAEVSDQQMSDLPASLSEQEVELSCLTYAERKKKISRDKPYARYEQVVALRRAGMGQRAIARELHMSRHILHRFIAAPTFPERAPGSGLQPVLQALEEGRQGQQLEPGRR